MRFVSAQFEALLGEGELWLRSARHANAMAARLAAAVAGIDGVEIIHPVEANGVFAGSRGRRSTALLDELPGEHPFYIWDEADGEVRWMCSWDTTPGDIDDPDRGDRRRNPRLSKPFERPGPWACCRPRFRRDAGGLAICELGP